MLRAMYLGILDGWRDSAFGITYDSDPESLRSRAYDRGRNIGDWARTVLAEAK